VVSAANRIFGEGFTGRGYGSCLYPPPRRRGCALQSDETWRV